MTGSTIPRRPPIPTKLRRRRMSLHCTTESGPERKRRKRGTKRFPAFLAGYVDDMKVAVGEALTEQKNAPESPEASAENTQSQEDTSKGGTGTPSSEPEPAPTPSQPAASSGKVPNSGEFTVSETVNVRKSANENSDRIGVCYSGEKLEILMKQADGWTRVKFQGETGYVKSDVLK